MLQWTQDEWTMARGGVGWGGGSHSMHLLQIGQMQSGSGEEFLIAGNMNIRTTPHSSLSIMGLVDAVGTLCGAVVAGRLEQHLRFSLMRL